jgi:molybdate transport system permease protein
VTVASNSSPWLPPEAWEAVFLTAHLAGVVTVLLLLLAVPLAWALSRSRSRVATVLEALVGLPIVLPPTVLGFYLLALGSPSSAVGRFWFTLTGDTLVFSFSGLVLGSICYSLPYAVQPLIAAFRAVPRELLDAGSALGGGATRNFFRIVLPLSRRGVLVAAMLSFAHTVGEFGVVVMLGGSIPGETRVASIALYDAVQRLDYAVAHRLALLLLAFAFTVLLVLTWLGRRQPAN